MTDVHQPVYYSQLSTRRLLLLCLLEKLDESKVSKYAASLHRLPDPVDVYLFAVTTARVLSTGAHYLIVLHAQQLALSSTLGLKCHTTSVVTLLTTQRTDAIHEYVSLAITTREQTLILPSLWPPIVGD